MSNKIFDDAFMKKLENLSLRFSNSVSNVYTGGRRSNASGSTVEFSNFREYIQGDDFRRIDWNAYARFEKFFIKLFLDEKQLNVRLFTDISASMNFGEPTKHFAAMRLAAALGYVSFRVRDNVEIFGLHNGECSSISGRLTSSSSFYSALEKMEDLVPDGETNLEKAIKDCRGIHSGDGVSIVISDLMSENDYKAALDYLLYHKQQTILIHVLSKDETEPALEGALRLCDSENDSYCEVIANSDTLKCYKDALDAYLAEIKAYCMQRGITYLPVMSDENIDTVLLDRGYRAGILQ